MDTASDCGQQAPGPVPTIPGLSEGRAVHYVLSEGDLPESQKHCAGRHCAAIVVRVWSNYSGCSNLTVFPDHSNDGFAGATYWALSRMYSETKEPGTWHWPERV
jgi:hypothetical protein